MSTAEIIIAVLSLLGVGALIPKIGGAVRDYFRGQTQADVSLILADKTTYANSLARVEKQADNLYLELMRIKEDYTQLAIAKGIAEYERDQGLKQIKELHERIDELESRSQTIK